MSKEYLTDRERKKDKKKISNSNYIYSSRHIRIQLENNKFKDNKVLIKNEKN